MSIVRQGTLPVGSLDHAITLNVQSSGGSHFETVTDTTPYLHRASPQDVASSMKLKKVVGGTVAWNQYVLALSTYSPTGATASATESEVALTVNSTGVTNGRVRISKTRSIKAPIGGHKYLISADVQATKAHSVTIYNGNSLIVSQSGLSASAWHTICGIKTQVQPTGLYHQIDVYGTFEVGDVVSIKNFNIMDLTQMFGTTIADYIYSLEQAHAGDGVAWFKALFGEDYYPYNAGELLSVKTSARKTYNADNVEIGSYALDDNLTLRGIPKLDSNNELYYDGDTYASDGTVTRKYGIRAYTEGDVTDGSTMITDGTNTVYKLITPTTESADAYTQSQRVGATEEFVDGRTVEIPVGNVSEYKRLIQEDEP